MPAAVTLIALQNFPLVQPSDDLAGLVITAIERSEIELRATDILVVAQKIVSKAEGRYVDLATVEPSQQAIELAREIERDPRLIEVILRESHRIVRHGPGVLIVEHRLGFVMANAGVDRSNIDPKAGEEPVLLLPADPDASAAALRRTIAAHSGIAPGVIVSDSFGRAWRNGTVGIALGAAGLPSMMDLRGKPDLYGRPLRVTETGFADEVAAAASLLMGQANEGVPVVLVRGLTWSAPTAPAARLIRAAAEDLFPVMQKDLVIALSGGVGGAKLALGLSRILPHDCLRVIANTGDDFEHFGLAISPDIDTLMYTLAGLDNPETGWGKRNETWNFMKSVAALGGEVWFQLGDSDLATHIERTRRLRAGETLSAITADFCRRLNIAAQIIPMTNDRVRTRVRTTEGWLDFQDYFVRRQCRPEISDILFDGADTAQAHPEFLAALKDPRLRAVVFCPSNPFISIDPILAMPGVREGLHACVAPVVAVAPIIGGHAVKGPTAKMMRELGLQVSAVGVARHYGDLLDAYILDHADEAPAVPALKVPFAATNTLMTSLQDREALARAVLAAADHRSGDAR